MGVKAHLGEAVCAPISKFHSRARDACMRAGLRSSRGLQLAFAVTPAPLGRFDGARLIFSPWSGGVLQQLEVANGVLANRTSECRATMID